MTTTQSTPTLAKMALGDLIARIRTRAGMERSELAAAIGTDPETIRRWEIGRNAPQRSSIAGIAEAISATPEERSRMNTLALDTKGRGLFEGSNVPPNLRVLYESEATARLIRSLELEHIPGLLQTPDYHRTVQDALVPVDPELSRMFRDLRTRRQEIVFARDPLPQMQFVIGMAAMLYLDAHPVMRAGQIERLVEVSRMPGVEIRVITGMHAGMLGSFTMLTPRRSAASARPFAYVEGIDGGRYLEGDVVSRYAAVLDTVVDGQSIELEEYLS